MRPFTIQAPYDGPEVSRNRSDWLKSPTCDGCGDLVEFKVWRDNRRHCGPACRPAWHLVPAVTCKLPGCGERIEREGGKGRPSEYCSDVCRRAAKTEDMRRKRAGLPSIETEAKGQKANFADWMPSQKDMEDSWEECFQVLDQYGWAGREEETDWGFDLWWKYGGDWPGMVPGLNRPAIRKADKPIIDWHGPSHPAPSPVLGSWGPWNAPEDTSKRYLVAISQEVRGNTQ